MTELFEPVGDHDWRVVAGGAGLLAEFNRSGVLEASDVHVAERVGDLAAETDERVLLAVALAVRAVRHGSVCVDLATVPALAPELPWPETGAWHASLLTSSLLAAGAVRYEHGLLYLDRYHRLEAQVCDDLRERAAQPPPVIDEAGLEAAVARIRSDHLSPEQERAAVRAVGQWTTVLTGGPGTGKTTTVARLLVLLADQAHRRGERLSVALSAPTGKAAARLQEAVVAELADLDAEDRDRLGRVEAMTLHRLLGWRADNTTRFRHDRGNRLKYDVVVVDESSMVELTMMARLLEAIRTRARLVLVGDPRQLTSVGAGAVLSDLVAGYEGQPASPVVTLTRNFRSTEDIKRLAEALRTGDADDVVAALRVPSDEVEFVETDDPAAVLRHDTLASAMAVRRAAEAGDAAAAVAALDRHRLLCAHREGPYGVRHWNRQVEHWVARGDRAGHLVRLVRRSAAAGVHQRLRPGRLQRRDRGRGPGAGRPTARLHRRVRRSSRLRARPARRGGDHARDDHPQEPGQPGRARDGAAAGRGVAPADPRAVLHRGHPGQVEGPGGRLRGRGPRGRGDPGAAGHRAAAAPRRRLTRPKAAGGSAIPTAGRGNRAATSGG